jgi:proteasome activator subunit 4
VRTTGPVAIMASNIYTLGQAEVDDTRSSTPVGNWRSANGNSADKTTQLEAKTGRSRPRTYPYFKYLPYTVESEEEVLHNLNRCIEELYIAVSCGDFSPGVIHWTREIRGWLTLKFDMPREIRIKLVYLFYKLSLAPGLDNSLCERFASMFMYLTKRKHYLRPGKDIVLDWKPLYKVLKIFVLPSEFGAAAHASAKRNVRTYTKMCTFAQIYFDPLELPAMLDEFLPFFSTSFSETAFVVGGLLNLFLPTSSPPVDRLDLLPQQHFPTFFHLWSLVNRSKHMDIHFIDIFSRSARDMLQCPHIEFSPYGIFTEEQATQIFSAILRIFELPVGESASAYTQIVDMHAGVGLLLDRDTRKHPIAHQIARWIVMSLSPSCATPIRSVLSCLEDLINGMETFFHPSNSGSWTRILSQFVYFLADFFVMRWNRERSGEMEVPEDRRLTEDVRRRFVLCLRDVVFMGIFAKSSTAINFSLSTLQCLAYLEPHLILPGALQRIYPAMQGLVEVHRTNSAIRALQVLTRIMARNVGYRCHIFSLLGLALPGIDPNDLEKTIHTLSFIQTVAYNVPFYDLSKEPGTKDDDNYYDAAIASQWVGGEIEKFEQAGPTIEIDYEKELEPAQELTILISTTTQLDVFVDAVLEKVFTLLKNLPDASRVRSGSPEENVVNTLPATFTPLLASLSPALYDIALDKIAKFVTSNTINQARDAVAFLCNALVKVNPEKALSRLLPELIAAIRTEIEENGAGSTRTIGSDILPRDQALVWHISMLSMCVVHVGGAAMAWENDLFNIAHFMQEKCQGIPTIHISNFIHHLLLNLTATYTLDLKAFEPEVYKNGISAKEWGNFSDPKKLSIKWYKPGKKEILFAIRLFKDQIKGAMDSLKSLIGDNSPIARDGTGKAWSDEVSRNLVLIRLILSGISCLWDPRHWKIMAGVRGDRGYFVDPETNKLESSDPSVASQDSMDTSEDEEEPNLSDKEDTKKPQFWYETGYPLDQHSAEYLSIHELREDTGQVLHQVHDFLKNHQEDDVQCFNSLYTAYRSWFVDIGIERSAHILDRVSRLLKADSHPYKFSGLRKDYPRPILVRRANLYHLQRLRYCSTPRPISNLEKQLLLDLAFSSMSSYTEIRRTAQGSCEYAVKTVIGARPLIIPPLLTWMEKAIAGHDYPRIKGGMFSLLFGSLAKTIHRDWRFAPRLIQAFIELTTVDKPSIQKLAGNATWSVMDMGRPLERMVIIDGKLAEALVPHVTGDKDDETIQSEIETKSKKIQERRNKVEAAKFKLSEELVEIARTSHWKKATRAATLLINLGMRFDRIASRELVQLVTLGSIDPHPQLRILYQGSLIGLFSLLDARATCDHDYKRFLMMDEQWPDKITVPVDATGDPSWTENFLESFSKPDAKYYIDTDYQGWLVWKKTMTAFTPSAPKTAYDEEESAVRSQIGAQIDKKWLKTLFGFLKQEPRDSQSDRFRSGNSMMLSCVFDLTFDGITTLTFDEIKDLTKDVYGDGSDKHQHRATAEILSALLNCALEKQPEIRSTIWEYVFPIVLGVFKDGLTPENSGYWNSFVHNLLQNRDPRRVWPLLDWLSSFRLDVGSNAAFKESSKIQLLNQAIHETGWHFQLDKGIVEDFLAHLDHPYKGVREAMGMTLAYIFRSRHHESYKDIDSLMKAQRESSSIGIRPYQPDEEFTTMINGILEKLEQWRKERTPGQQTPSSYTQGSKTVLLWLETQICSYECVQLVKFFPGAFTQELLHMIDVKEDPELQSLAYHVFRQLPNVPQRSGEDKEFINSLTKIGREATSWHQRMRVLINIQVIYYRRMFLLSRAQKLQLFDCVAAMLADSQLEVRLGAQSTLSGMIKCSPIELRDEKILELKKLFSVLLSKNPVLRRVNFSERSSTPTIEQNKTSLTRHSAVLGLGALIQAFPYTSPPPEWLPETLATLASKAAGDPGVVGKGAKQILADFKKLRQDTWHVDKMVSFSFFIYIYILQGK